MNEIVQMIGLACLTVILIEAVPIKIIKDAIGLKTNSKYAAISFIAQLTNCALCLGTYIGMFGMMSFAKGAIVAVVAEIISKKLNTHTL